MLAAVLSFSCAPPSTAPLGTQHLPYITVPDQAPLDVQVEQLIDDTLNSLESASLTPVEKQARSAAVKVIRPLGDGHGSGTYMRMHGRFVVVTAAHVVGTNTVMIIEARGAERVMAQAVYNDESSDLAILVCSKLKTRTAIPYRPRRTEVNLVGASLTYTGFPGRHDLLTIRGYVAAVERGYVVTNMFGWFGSSGSGVFDVQGRLVGIVSAIDVGNWYMPIPLDSIVWVAPMWELDEDIVKVRVKLAAADESFNSFPGAAAPRRGASAPR
jgi:S1-C subfamily serine protease